MSKNKIILVVALLWGTIGFGESILVDTYYVVSDVEDKSVPEGQCVVKGRVWEGYSEEFVSGGIIATLNRKSHTLSNDTGYYEMKVSARDTAIFFYHEKYKEIVCWNYNFQSQHVVTINFITSDRAGQGVIYEAEKPVIYLYPEKETDVTVKMDDKIEITTSYPEYNGGWDITASPDGTLKQGDREYPYLFWEGPIQYQQFGFFPVSDLGTYGLFINSDTVVSFLEKELAMFGLNAKESADFITYWAPRMQRHTYNLVYFMLDEEYDNTIGTIEVTPKPDVIRRVYLVFCGLDFEIDTVPNRTIPDEPLNRDGFVVIEWGGTELSSPSTP
ncbi:MAG: hypothetical protein HUJ25_04870 [Crocinitomicaceae bacterium]|nr:hypothetical protein [Crocinitomicaceae bacterium]